MKQKTRSWTTIGIWLIFFFPVGIPLLVKKVTSEKDRYIQNGNSIKKVGIGILCFTVISIILYTAGELQLTEDSNQITVMITMFIILPACGLFCMYKGKQISARGKRYEDLIPYLALNPYQNLDILASELKIPLQTVIADLKYLIQVGYISNVYIDMANHRLCIKQINPEIFTVTCPHCGGKNDITLNITAKCEYCDSPISK